MAVVHVTGDTFEQEVLKAEGIVWKKRSGLPGLGSRGHEKNGDLFRKCIRKDQCGNGQPVSAGNPAPASGRTDREWIFRRNRKMPGKRTAYQRIVRDIK